MGNQVSFPDCCLLSQLPPEKFAELLAERFTVVRTNGEKQDGWRISSEPHTCRGVVGKAHAQVWDHTVNGEGEKDWRCHMVLDTEGEHCCGWRRFGPGNRTFWPTRLTTQEERETWWAEFDALVRSLKRFREMVALESNMANSDSQLR
jgi:hypothetical protein